MDDILKRAVDYGRKFIGEGKPAHYIPELSKVDSELLGVSVIDFKGRKWEAGDSNHKFTIQSISKTVALMLALEDRGFEYIFSRVGMEPSGDAFNSIIKLETTRTAMPQNPMINAGAIAVDSFIVGKTLEEKKKRLLDYFRIVLNNDKLQFNEQVYQSEKSTGHRNRSLAYFMKDQDIVDGNVEDVLDLYFYQCAIEVDCNDISNLGALLAADGINPRTGIRLITKETARLVKTFMVTCGMYDASGEFAVKVGLPSKSGVGGGIMTAVPGKMGIGVFGPALDIKGNSIGGIKILEYISKELDLSIF